MACALSQVDHRVRFYNFDSNNFYYYLDLGQQGSQILFQVNPQVEF
jgi:hypothetical protein